MIVHKSHFNWIFHHSFPLVSVGDIENLTDGVNNPSVMCLGMRYKKWEQ